MEDPVLESLKEFKRLVDWDRFPLPEVVYEKYGIKKPKPLEVGDVVYYRPPMAEYEKEVEIREAAPGGVRDISGLDPLPITQSFIPNPDEPQTKDEAFERIMEKALGKHAGIMKFMNQSGTSASGQPETPEQSACSTEATETKIRVLEDLPSLPAPCVEPDITASSPHHDAQ